MKLLLIGLRGLIWLLFITLFCTIGSLILWYGFIEPIGRFARGVATIVFVSIPSYILTAKVMKYVKIEKKD
jgi:hypothetical protein